MNKKLLLTLGTTAVVATPIFATVSCSLFGGESGGRSGLEFYNYEDYISDSDINATYGTPSQTINNYYKYQTFGDLPEFENYIRDQRTIGGVGSDYFNASLAERGYLRKIDFEKLFNFLPESDGRYSIEETLKKIYTPESWSIMNEFSLYQRDENGNKLYWASLKDENGNPTIVNGEVSLNKVSIWDTNKYVYYKTDDIDSEAIEEISSQTIIEEDADINDIDGDGVEDKLWEYMIPYFSQNKVAAFNPFSSSFKNVDPTILEKLQSTNQSEIDSVFPDKSYEGILKTLRDLMFGVDNPGKLNFTNNNYFRDNMMIGSESLNNGNTVGYISSIDEGKRQLDSYKTMVEKYANVVNVNTSGTDTLTTLLTYADQDKSIADVSFMYNGDALYGYYGGDVDNANDGELRIVTPRNSTFLLDGIILVKSTSESQTERNRFYDAIRESFLNGSQRNPSDVDFATFKNAVYTNFDYVNYTPAFSNVYDYIVDGDNYFEDDTSDSIEPIDKIMIMSTRESAGDDSKNINSSHQAQVIPANWTSNLVDYNENEIAKVS